LTEAERGEPRPDRAVARIEDAGWSVGHDDGGGIHHDRRDLAEQVVVTREQHLAAGARDRHADLVVELEAAGTLPVLLGDEHLHEVAQPRSLLGRQQRVGGHVLREDLRPRGGELLLEEPATTTLGEPAKHRYSLSERPARAASM
jgi:hypothetical protein